MKEALEVMLAELEGNCLEVCLIPCRRETNHGGMIRCALSRNCDWYRRLCARHLSSRARRNLALDTKVKRARIIIVLNQLIEYRVSRSKYAPEILKIAEKSALCAA